MPTLPAIKEKIESVFRGSNLRLYRGVCRPGSRVQVVERVPQATGTDECRKRCLSMRTVRVIAPAKEKEGVPVRDDRLERSEIGSSRKGERRASKDVSEDVGPNGRSSIFRREFSRWISTDMREPRAFIEDSGTVVSIALGREKFGEYLKRGINAIVGKGEMFEAVNLVGQNMILAPRKARRSKYWYGSSEIAETGTKSQIRIAKTKSKYES